MPALQVEHPFHTRWSTPAWTWMGGRGGGGMAVLRVAALVSPAVKQKEIGPHRHPVDARPPSMPREPFQPGFLAL